jgi:hypothetical protein
MNHTDNVRLEYDDDDFAPKAARLIRARQAIFVAVRGPACSMLRPQIRDGKFVDLPKLGLVPKLQPLLGVVTFALGRDLRVLCEEHEDMIGVWIGAVGA